MKFMASYTVHFRLGGRRKHAGLFAASPRAAVAQVTEYWAARGQEIESPKVVGLRNAEFGMRRGK